MLQLTDIFKFIIYRFDNKVSGSNITPQNPAVPSSTATTAVSVISLVEQRWAYVTVKVSSVAPPIMLHNRLKWCINKIIVITFFEI